MKKRLILAGLGMAVIVAGLATFAANTAQWVNIEARVEKEIEVACVDRDGNQVDCDFGVVFPQNVEERVVEVTLSNSFENQDVKSDVLYWVLWECKQFDDGRDLNGDTIPDCRVDAPVRPCYNPVHGKWENCDDALDGMIRDYITVTPSDPSCLSTYNGPTGLPKHIEGIGNGVVDRDVQPKCLYHLTFTPPACEGHFNPYTDPAPVPSFIRCNEVTTDPDPQNWDRWAQLGDDFKIQVYDFSYD
jgi:hypothetical protein